MNALLLDSSDKNLTVGLFYQKKMDEISYFSWQRQSENMVPEIDKILERNGCQKEELDAIVCSKGPGSYTGVRIAMSIAKTISFALNLPLYLVSSLEALKDGDRPSVCLMNARAKRSYIGVYQGKEVLLKDTILTNAEVLEFIAEHKDYSICGDVSYLGLEAKAPLICANLVSCIDDAHRCLEPLGARPIYLKDDYEDISHKIAIRPVKDEDIPALVDLENECFEPPYTENGLRYDLHENEFARLYVAVRKTEIIGYIHFSITFSSATINRIAVRKAFRKEGIGGLLLDQALKDCKEAEEPVDFLTLEVRVSNENAKEFYAKRGFEKVTIKRAYYTDGEDALYMVRPLFHEQNLSD